MLIKFRATPTPSKKPERSMGVQHTLTLPKIQGPMHERAVTQSDLPQRWALGGSSTRVSDCVALVPRSACRGASLAPIRTQMPGISCEVPGMREHCKPPRHCRWFASQAAPLTPRCWVPCVMFLQIPDEPNRWALPELSRRDLSHFNPSMQSR